MTLVYLLCGFLNDVSQGIGGVIKSFFVGTGLTSLLQFLMIAGVAILFILFVLIPLIKWIAERCFGD